VGARGVAGLPPLALPSAMNLLRPSRPVAVVLFLLLAALIVGVPMVCAVGSANDEDTPRGDDVEVEGIPDPLDG